MNAVGNRARGDAADENIDAAVQQGRDRKQHQSQHQRYGIGYVAAVTRGGEQKRGEHGARLPTISTQIAALKSPKSHFSGWG